MIANSERAQIKTARAFVASVFSNFGGSTDGEILTALDLVDQLGPDVGSGLHEEFGSIQQLAWSWNQALSTGDGFIEPEPMRLWDTRDWDAFRVICGIAPRQDKGPRTLRRYYLMTLQ
ncbi:MAG TPA: hypothetical protein VGF92_02885 [Stellaceae bacterium]|jgi:hypothetical protein